jgi:hopanoid biosynthesis associated protein HpnK
VRRLIINADDFGITEGVNRAVIEAHSCGVVTSTTLMANGGRFAEAVSASRNLPKLSVGCHVVLVDGEPLSRPDRVRSLCAHAGPQFPATFGSIARRVLSDRVSLEEIELEVATQIAKLQSTGLAVTHVDSHKHVHMLSLVAKGLIEAAAKCGIRAIRNPFVPLKPLMLAHVLKRPTLWTRYAETKVLRGYHRQFRRMVADAGMVTTDGSFGVVSTGFLDADLFRAIASAIPEGTWEFVCHPGYVDDELNNVRTRLRQSREHELQILTSSEARKALADNGIELISFRDLSANV